MNRNHFYAVFLGRFSLYYQGEELCLGASFQSKSTQIFLMLLKAGDKGLERKVLLDLIRPDEMDQKKRMNNFRQQVHTLRKIIARSGFPEGDYIVPNGSRYYFSLTYQIRSDTEYLDERICQLKNELLGKEALFSLCQEYCQVYTGEFLPTLGGEEWVTVENAYYHKWYFYCVAHLCEQLKEQGDREELLELCAAASRIHPYDQWQVEQIKCLMAMNRYQEAEKIYEEARERYYQDLGVTSLERVMASCRSENSQAGAIAVLKEELAKQGEQNDAYCCGYPNFLDVYRIVTRIGERTGMRQVLLLCTVEDSREIELEKVMLRLRQALLKSIRKGDVYTRYSANQYLALLIGAGEEAKDVITARLEQNWKSADPDGKTKVGFIIQEVKNQQ